MTFHFAITYSDALMSMRSLSRCLYLSDHIEKKKVLASKLFGVESTDKCSQNFCNLKFVLIHFGALWPQIELVHVIGIISIF